MGGGSWYGRRECWDSRDADKSGVRRSAWAVSALVGELLESISRDLKGPETHISEGKEWIWEEGVGMWRRVGFNSCLSSVNCFQVAVVYNGTITTMKTST